MPKKKMEVTIIVTVLNEAQTVMQLLNACMAQTYLPRQIILVDGGSTDQTWNLLQHTQKKFPSIINAVQKKGNRSVGRNEAIRLSHTAWIAITDAGCIPQPDWLEQLVIAAEKKNGEELVVSGYYFAKPQTPFEEAVIPYVLVMPDRVNPDHFLPATRSMLLSKSIWEEVGGFDELLSDNEDYAFAKEIEKARFPIVFAQHAQVEWFPRTSLSAFAWMIFRFARGDIAAGILRPKVVALFGRYLLGLVLTVFLLKFFSAFMTVGILLIGLLGYSLWAIRKNKRYVPKGWYWLPILQITADLMVMSGSVSGFLQRVGRKVTR